MEDKPLLKPHSRRNFTLKGFVKLVFIALVILSLGAGCGLVKHYPSYYGRVIDAETKEPLEGAAVLAVYYTQQPSPGGPVSFYREAQETVTDKNGEFTIPSITLTTFKFLDFFRKYPLFTIFKPGYGAFPDHKDVRPRFLPAKQYTIIELPRLKTREERIRYSGYLPSDDVPKTKYKNMFRLIQEERKALGLEPRKQPWQEGEMIQRLLRNLISACIVFLLPLTAFPYDNKTVHKEINEAASRQSKNVAAALKILGFDNGVDSVVNEKKIVEWFREGGKEEDEPLCRTKFHFHDPLAENFNDAGLHDSIVDKWCNQYDEYKNRNYSSLFPQRKGGIA